MLGLTPTPDGLDCDPHLPAAFGDVALTGLPGRWGRADVTAEAPARSSPDRADRGFRNVGRTRQTARMTDDDGVAIAYDVLRPGTPVVDSDGAQVGTVHEVLDNKREHIFDGIVVSTPEGAASSTPPRSGASPSNA